jgi:hypothetical protein
LFLDTVPSLDDDLDRLADLVERHIDLPGVEAIVDRGVES